MAISTELHEKHIAMVQRLIKPPQQLLDEASASKMNLLHAVLGIVSEIEEYAPIVEDIEKCAPFDRANLIEEMGDSRFYIQQLCTESGLSYPRVDEDRRTEFLASLESHLEESAKARAVFRLSYCDIARYSSEIADIVKRHVIYGQGLNMGKLNAALGNLEFALYRIRAVCNITSEEVVAANIHKLDEGENARYKEGYSDAAAEARADKQDAE